MKQGIHPKLHEKAKTTCTTCGTVFMIPCTVATQQIEICSHCHPIYTGKYRGAVGSGRVERFRKMMETAKVKAATKPVKKELTPEEKLRRRAEEARAMAQKARAEREAKKRERTARAAKKATVKGGKRKK